MACPVEANRRKVAVPMVSGSKAVVFGPRKCSKGAKGGAAWIEKKAPKPVSAPYQLLQNKKHKKGWKSLPHVDSSHVQLKPSLAGRVKVDFSSVLAWNH